VTQTAAARPTIPRAVAQALATRSDAIAEALDAGDVCTAAVRADELQRATIAAINNGQVPPQFAEELQSHANELVNAVNCPPPADAGTAREDTADGDGTRTEPGADKDEKKNEKKGKKDKGNGKGNNGDEDSSSDDVATVPVPDDVSP
jgi:hypothetical protein